MFAVGRCGGGEKEGLLESPFGERRGDGGVEGWHFPVLPLCLFGGA